jgi:hypothetical protein
VKLATTPPPFLFDRTTRTVKNLLWMYTFDSIPELSRCCHALRKGVDREGDTGYREGKEREAILK